MRLGLFGFIAALSFAAPAWAQTSFTLDARNGPPVVEALRAATDLPLDVHLMMVEPERMIADFAHAGADRILVIDAGGLAEQGRHDELLRAGGRYARMWARQANEEDAV